MLPGCPAEMLLTLQLKTGKLSILMGSDQVRSVMLTTGQFPIKYGQLVCKACWDRYLPTTGMEVPSDKTVAI